MSIFDWLRGSDSPSNTPEEKSHVSEDWIQTNIAWVQLEEALARAIHSEIAKFAKAHPNEQFYGFALDCNAYYADILFCLNTPEHLETLAKEYADSNEPSEIADQKKEFEWGLGDWKYQGFNLDSTLWQSEMSLLDEFAEHPGDTEAFLVTCCRALLAAERTGAFNQLRRTPEFRVACIDHDEDISAGEKRLEYVRRFS